MGWLDILKSVGQATLPVVGNLLGKDSKPENNQNADSTNSTNSTNKADSPNNQ